MGSRLCFLHASSDAMMIAEAPSDIGAQSCFVRGDEIIALARYSSNDGGSILKALGLFFALWAEAQTAPYMSSLVSIPACIMLCACKPARFTLSGHNGAT